MSLQKEDWSQIKRMGCGMYVTDHNVKFTEMTGAHKWQDWGQRGCGWRRRRGVDAAAACAAFPRFAPTAAAAAPEDLDRRWRFAGSAPSSCARFPVPGVGDGDGGTMYWGAWTLRSASTREPSQLAVTQRISSLMLCTSQSGIQAGYTGAPARRSRVQAVVALSWSHSSNPPHVMKNGHGFWMRVGTSRSISTAGHIATTADTGMQRSAARSAAEMASAPP